MSPETKQLFSEAAEQRDMNLGPWLIQAGFSYARSAKRSSPKNAQAFVWPSGWPKDRVCGECSKLGHDPKEAHGLSDEVMRFLLA